MNQICVVTNEGIGSRELRAALYAIHLHLDQGVKHCEFEVESLSLVLLEVIRDDVVLS